MRNAARLSIVIGAAAAWLAGIGLSGADPDSQAFDQVEKGRYLTTVADCFACHTVPEVGKPFAGARGIETPFGVITSSNITPDNDTGIGTGTVGSGGPHITLNNEHGGIEIRKNSSASEPPAMPAMPKMPKGPKAGESPTPTEN